MMDRETPKHVEFYSKNKIEELVHLGFIMRIEYVSSGTDVTSVLVRCTNPNICGHVSFPISHPDGVQVTKKYGMLVMKPCIGGDGKMILKWISEE
jgi:hypothetical protein